MNNFSYHSEQIHSMFKNGKGKTRRNVVSIKNGKGTKSVETYLPNGNQLDRVEKELTQTELNCIEKHKFIPGFFKDCIKPMRPKRKTVRRRNK